MDFSIPDYEEFSRHLCKPKVKLEKRRQMAVDWMDKELEDCRHQSEISTVDVDLDNVKATKSYAENLRKNFVVPNSQQKQPHRKLENLDLDQYASSLDVLSKRLMNMKHNKTSEDFKKNDELEAKLTRLCDDVNMFTQMFQSMVKLSEANKNWSPTQYSNTAFQYDNLINKLLLGVKQVTYLQNVTF